MLKIKKDFLLALIIYLTSVAQMPQTIFYIIIMLLGIYYSLGNFKKLKFEKSDIILIVFIIGTSISFVVGKVFGSTSYIFKDYERSIDLFPFTIILFGTIFFSKSISLELMKYLLYFIIFESGVAIFEFIIGIQYIIPPGDIGGETKFGETDLLYYNRVFGLSPNVSVLGLKLVVGIVFFIFLEERKYFNISKIYLLLMMTTTLLSFQRTAILTVLLFLIMYYFPMLFKIKLKLKLVLIFVSLCVSFLIISKFDLILFQFTRGKTEDFNDVRSIVFGFFIDFSLNNFIWGNFSEKIYMSFWGHSYHAHNSYLQLLATVGLPLFVVWILYLSQIINKYSLIFVFPFFVYSLTQYGIFWGCSLFDIAMYSLIFQSKFKLENKQDNLPKNHNMLA